MRFSQILRECQDLLKSDQSFHVKRLTGGSSSKLHCLLVNDTPRYVIKQNDPDVLRAEVKFLETYEGFSLLPEVIHFPKGFDYIFYTYVKGDSVRSFNKREWLMSLVDHLISKYKLMTNENERGYLEDPSFTWRDFLIMRLNDSYKLISEKEILDVQEFVKLLRYVNDFHATETSPAYLLHGDCGVHNFLFEGRSLTGVIDPTPVIGPIYYDLIYAFCSSPEDLTLECFLPAFQKLNVSKSVENQIIDEVLLGLYFRIASCLRHHPEDIDLYVNAWHEWKRKR